ncbi:MAG: putative spermidine/putrescine transport system ATP-binding protein [Paracoccaceae bacterium]|jgi:putative spermidine/putrescine transport system ATP-binding protein
MPDLVLKDVRMDYGATRAVDNVSLTFKDGELTALLGPSGCGKTTLLRIVAGLEQPTRGALLLDGADITDLSAHKRKFGMVFQSFALFPHMRVLENVAYSLAIAGVEKTKRLARAQELLDLVQLADFGGRQIGALSGGQRQRVAIARALAQEPEVFLLDEPMSALDAKLREEMQVELRLLQQRLKITTIVVTHDQREAMTMADTVVVMSNGRAEQVGNPQDIYHKPANAFVADFIGRTNFFDATVDNGALVCGDVQLRVEPPAPFRNGMRVRAACRPEKVWIDHPPPVPTTNTLKAEVTFVRNIGPARDVHLKTPLGAFVVEYAIGENSAPYSIGQIIDLHLPPAALQVFPAGAAS